MLEQKTTVTHKALWNWIIPPTFLAMLTFFIYYPSLSYPFQFDDYANIVKFFNIRYNTFSSLFFQNTRWISYWLNSLYYAYAKYESFIYRLGNITAHIATGVILFFIFYTACRNIKNNAFLSKYSLPIAYLTSGLFLLHPVQSQTVSYVIQGQLEGLACLFIVSMIFCFMTLASTPKGWKRAFLIGMLYLIAISACCTKEIAIISPALVLLFDWFFIAQGSTSSLKKRAYLHVGLWIVVFGIYIYMLKPAFFASVFGLSINMHNNIGNVLTENTHERITALHYCISEFKVILHYISIFFWPFAISVDYDWKMVRSFFSLDCIIPLILLLGAAYYTFRRLSKNKTDIISFGILWFFIAILPRSSIIPSSELLADYKTYIASIGILFIIAYLLICACTRLTKKEFSQTQQIALWTLFLLPIGYTLYERNKVWRSTVEFWGNIVKNSPNKARGHNNYGVALCEKSKYKEAIPHFERAIALDNRYADPYNNIAIAHGTLGDIDKAIAALNKSINIHPNQPEAYQNIASFYIQTKKFDLAEKMLHKAIKIRPHYGKAYFNLGRLYLEINEKEKAWEALKAACTRGDFDNKLGFDAYNKASLALKKYDDALFACNKLLAINPHDYETLFTIAHIHFAQQKYEQALEEYKELAQVQGDAKAFYQIGECYVQLKKYPEALDYFKKVISIHKGFTSAYFSAAECLNRMGKRAQALSFLENFIAMNPPQEFKEKALKKVAALKHGV